MLATIHTMFVNDKNIFILSILNMKHKRNGPPLKYPTVPPYTPPHLPNSYRVKFFQRKEKQSKSRHFK